MADIAVSTVAVRLYDEMLRNYPGIDFSLEQYTIERQSVSTCPRPRILDCLGMKGS
jgi:hypothetical protein